MNWAAIKKSLSHAFEVSDGRSEISEEDMALLNKIASFIVRRRLVAPATMLLGTVRPLNFVGSSIMNFFKPTLGTLLAKYEYERLEKMLEKRCTIELLVECIEQQNRSNETNNRNGEVTGCQKTKSMSS